MKCAEEVRRLIATITNDAVRIAILRGNLVSDDGEEVDEDTLVGDVTAVLCGEEFGCLDPDDPEDAKKITAIPDAVIAFASAAHSCQTELDRAGLSAGRAQDGDRWECPCGRRYVHVCDEANGCYWREAQSRRGRRHEVRRLR